MHAREARTFGAATWLLMAAHDPVTAHRDWGGGDVALLRCGTLFTAVRVPLDLVETAAGTGNPWEIGVYLNEALLGGAVFTDRTAGQVYFLVLASAWGRWNVPGTECLSPGMLLGVPRPGVDQKARSHWLLEMDGPGVLCMEHAVKQLVEHARLRAAQSVQDGA
ncbi:hypothetical protein ABZ923_37290 [Streptomyces sp. NPDC046881]|uniref:hypothetical protein n=1 Tax=Streptomyces sp. NPDC046881 TaxID=3155374 RepID=UPI0033D1037B